MKKSIFENFKAICILLVIIVAIRSMDFFPWWIFVIPVILIGYIYSCRRKKILFFLCGFIAGFLIWFGGNFYFDVTSHGIILDKIGGLLSVSKYIVLIISGLIGGVISGLSFYIGKNIMPDEKILTIGDGRI